MKTIQITNRRLDTSALVNMATDYEVEHWQFVLPTAYDGVTLPLTGWGVGYQRADSQGDIDERVTVAVVEDNLTVEYAPKDGIVAKAGPLTIWLQCVDADGHSVYQTLPAVITVARKPVPTNIPNDQDFLDRAVAAALEAGEARDESEAARDGILENAGFQAVAGALVPIGTVADAVGSVQTVAEHVGAVGAVAGAVEEVGTVAGAVAKVSTVADSIIKVGTVADSIVKVEAVADGMAHVTAVEAKLTEVAKVAAIDGDVAKVALIDGDVSKVAALEQSVPVVAGVADELEQLAPVVSQIEQLALIKDQIVSLEAEKLKVVAVEAKLTEIQGVYAKLAAIEGVYGKSTEIDALYAQLDTIAAKANQADLDAVEDRLDTLEGIGAGSVAKAIDDAVSPLEEDITDHESRIELLEGLQPLETWEDVQKVAKAGFASKYLKAGDLIETTYAGNPAVVEVVGINQDTPPEGTTDYKDVISFHFKDCLQNAQYSAPQALFNAVEGLSAGTYTFVNSYDSLPYTFTLTQAVPAGGVIVITSWGASTYEPTVLKTMQADRLTDIETGVAVTQASGGMDLAPVNFTPRCRYGTNLYIESGIRHFLNDNSDSYVWAAQGLYDMPSTYGAGGGFLKRLDADFASVIGPVVKKVARATADGGGQDTFEDKVWLLSRVEMGYGTEGVTTGEQVYERWNGATNAERIKLLSGSPWFWWLRPPYVSYQYLARLVNTDGTLNYYSSSTSYGLAPGLAVY